MRKYGKFEKQPAAPAGEKPTSKNALLQTYFTSLVSMVLCCTMFLGTSYAWFTSEITSYDNHIYVGMLDVGLFRQDATERVDLGVTGNKLFAGRTWEPGYTAMEKVVVVNEGDLAFQYSLSFINPERAWGSKSVSEIASCFEVWVYEGNAAKPANYESLAHISGWKHLGTLKDVLDGTVLFSGTCTEENEADTYTIVLHMNDDADAGMMDHILNLDVKLVAFQMASEPDDFGNVNYDDIVMAMNAQQLKQALASGDKVIMSADTSLLTLDDRLTMTGGTFDGAGNTITYNGLRENDTTVGVLTTNGGTVSNLNIDGKSNGRALYVTRLGANLQVSGCNLTGAYGFSMEGAVKSSYTVTFSDCTLGNWTAYTNSMSHAYFNDCTFVGAIEPGGDSTFTDCRIEQNALRLEHLEAGETVTLIHCYLGGVLVDKVVLTASGDSVVVSGSDAVRVNDQLVLVMN